MVKTLFIILLLSLSLYGESFKKNCLECHSNEFQFSMFMKKYTLRDSSEKRIKKAIFTYLKNPTVERSVLPSGYLSRFGIKEKTTLSDDELKKMIDIYYERYNLQSRIY